MYNELLLKQETPINHQTKLSFHMFIVGDIDRSCKMWQSNNNNNIPIRTLNITTIFHDVCFLKSFL